MVPYVRKSFCKHYRDGYKYLVDEDTILDFGGHEAVIEIDSDVFTKHQNVYKYAMDLTIREINQSVEAMFHNLND